MLNPLHLDTPIPGSPVVSDGIIQSMKATVDKQTEQIQGFEKKVADLESTVGDLVI
jgi:hypothetical protein